MNQKNKVLTGLALAFTLGFSGAAFAQDDTELKKKKMLTDPMTRAELQCVKLRADAANGSADGKKIAEMKCAQAVGYAKEMVAKKAKNKRKPVPEADPNS